MKATTILIAAFVAAATTLCGCKSTNSLAKNVDGVWQGEPRTAEVGDANTVSYTDTYEFTHTQGANGTVVISTLMTLEEYMPTIDEVITPLSIDVAATASIKGTYTATSGSTITLTLDPATLHINVDPDAVAEVFNALDGKTSAEISALKSRVANSAHSELSDWLTYRYAQPITIKSITLTKTLMQCKIAGTDATLRLLP